MARNSTKTDARPSMQFYPADWMTDPAVRLCSVAARGLWIDLLCLMFRSPSRGKLTKANGSKYEARDIAKLVGESEANVKQMLDELVDNAACSVDDDGTVYNRRMVRDTEARAKLSEVRAEAGRRGGRSRPQAKGKANKASKAQAKPQAKQAASSSTSTSTSLEALDARAHEGNLPAPTELALIKPTDDQLSHLQALCETTGIPIEDALASRGYGALCKTTASVLIDDLQKIRDTRARQATSKTYAQQARDNSDQAIASIAGGIFNADQ